MNNCLVCNKDAGNFPSSIDVGYGPDSCEVLLYPICKECKKEYEIRVIDKQMDIRDKIRKEALKIIKSGGVLKKDIKDCDCRGYTVRRLQKV